MMMFGEKTALDLAVEEHRQRELQAAEGQLDLFGAPAAADAAPPAAAPAEVAERPAKVLIRPGRGGGRPVGSRNRRTDEAARIYMAEFGDPLRRGAHISALPILAAGVLEGLAQRLGCSRHDAAKWWAGIYAATMPYMHTRQATLTIRPEGAPDGDPAELDWALTTEGELIDVSPNPAAGEPEAEAA